MNLPAFIKLVYIKRSYLLSKEKSLLLCLPAHFSLFSEELDGYYPLSDMLSTSRKPFISKTFSHFSAGQQFIKTSHLLSNS
jgi:hypothetical protein